MLTGSVNATDNGMQSNIEDSLVVRDKETMEEWKSHFFNYWEGPDTAPVTAEVMEEVRKRRKEKAEKKGQKGDTVAKPLTSKAPGRKGRNARSGKGSHPNASGLCVSCRVRPAVEHFGAECAECFYEHED